MTDHNDDNTRTHVVLTKGAMVSHYRIVEKIGAGGMGEVYLAEDTKLKRKVALKFLPSHLISNAEVRTRFVREAQTVAKLNHPNVISIYEVSELSGRPYYVMELVEGETLEEIVQGKTLPFDVITEYAIQICQGLGEAHRASIVHRDIKAANIAVDTQGRVRVLDFGLAATAGDEKLTKTGSTLGTVAYMSPEQVSGRDIDHRSDLFSLGVVLYELIAGQTPFKRDNEGATLKAIIEDNPEPLTRYKSDVPEKLQEIVFKLLEKDRELRYQSAEGVIADLKRLMYDSQQTGYTRMARRSGKTPTVVGVTAVLMVVAAALLYFQFRPVGDGSHSDDAVPMIAVLPFENLGSPEDDYFADGITEEITSRLAMIKGLGVISRMSSVKLRESHKTLQEIGRDHGIDYVLEGTVRWSKVGDQLKVRITPQLIQVSDDRHLWASNYERTLMEVFAVQADIAEKIVDQLGLTLLESDRQNLASIPTDNPEAYKFYLQALQHVRRSTGYSDSKGAQTALDSAVILDSSFALAHALRSESYTNVAGGLPETENGKTALEAAERALELQPGLSQGHLALGRYYYFVAADNEKALEHFSRAKSELYNDPELLNAISNVQIEQNYLEEALVNRSKAADLDPLNPRRHSNLARVLRSLRRFSEAEQSINRAIALNPEAQYYYESKIEGLIAQYGDIERIKPVVNEALEYCDTSKFVIKNSAWTRFIPDLKTDSVIAGFFQMEVEDTSKGGMFPELSSYGLGHLDMLENKPEEARKRAGGFDGTFDGWQGLLLSFAGDCEQAIEAGLRDKELVETTDCSP
ncbi:MAG: tetratricopeptide repeat-containing serine/threonine-protein kinase [candidate division Zixibacteria bacterium]|nr:tetratricopeptide repeat-containing serine/threonine-protein kinase [candidate division Zixibacteria bacterium]MDH3937614.1 tetratricopeptide repeat-containing serine/threonine-protein kinase [candidate division Zixibacteria bacterium]MDH4032379.1 tetratricopeptide repeat-containing serine/threonine-protein kinase [candidate division Zixibacteria bacterium]